MYKLNKHGITRLSDGASIPNDPSNTDYARYLAWCASPCDNCEGRGVVPKADFKGVEQCPVCRGMQRNTPEPADIPPAPTYQELRAAAYPSFADQFDLIYHGGTALWKEAIDAVKNKYPKP